MPIRPPVERYRMSFNRSAALPALALSALALLAGCSPESRTTDPSPSEVPFQNGSLSGTTTGRVSPAQTTSGPGATLTGLAGTFTSLSVSGSALGNVSTVYFNERGSSGGLRQIRTDGTGFMNILSDTTRGFSPSISPSGDRLFFWQGRGPGDQPQAVLMERLPDGTASDVFTDVRAFAPVAWTPDEKQVVYPYLTESATPPTTLLRRLDLTTLDTQDLVPDRPYLFGPAVTVGPVNDRPVAIYVNAERGLSLLDLTSGVDSTLFTPADSDFVSDVDLTRDGQRLVFALTRRIGPDTFLMHVRVGDPNHPEAAESLFTFPGNRRFTVTNTVRWIPDGSGFVVTAPGDPNGSIQLYLLDAQGHVVRQLTRVSQGVVYESDFTVGPSARGTQVLIGEGGLLGSTASGIIFGQNQTGRLTSVVAFQSDRPRTVTLKASTGLNSTGPALIYSLSAEQLRMLRFINGPPDGRLFTVIDSSTAPTGGALINFDADSGTVTLVLPFAAGQSSAATVTESGGSRIFRGHFLGAWQGKTNFAPQGASEVRLETSTGRVEVTP